MGLLKKTIINKKRNSMARETSRSDTSEMRAYEWENQTDTVPSGVWENTTQSQSAGGQSEKVLWVIKFPERKLRGNL